MFCEKFGIEWAYSLKNILTRTQTYINYEEELVSEYLDKVRGIGNPGIGQGPDRDNNQHQDDEDRESRDRFLSYTSLNT